MHGVRKQSAELVIWIFYLYEAGRTFMCSKQIDHLQFSLLKFGYALLAPTVHFNFDTSFRKSLLSILNQGNGPESRKLTPCVNLLSTSCYL